MSRAVSSDGRAQALQAWGRGFDPHTVQEQIANQLLNLRHND